MESIQYKFHELGFNDLEWPSFMPQSQAARSRPPKRSIFTDSNSDMEESDEEELLMKKYWENVLNRHNSELDIHQDVSTAELDRLPQSWVVVSISLTEDKSTLLVSRQRALKEPFVFCIPLRGRRENDDEEHFTYDDAVEELNDIIRCKDESTSQASHIDKEDKEGKAAWWAERKKLDGRMKDLLENIEFCWLGAFKVRLFCTRVCNEFYNAGYRRFSHNRCGSRPMCSQLSGPALRKFLKQCSSLTKRR